MGALAIILVTAVRKPPLKIYKEKFSAIELAWFVEELFVSTESQTNFCLIKINLCIATFTAYITLNTIYIATP